MSENQKRRANARTKREEKTVEIVVVASDEGPGAGASAAETLVAAITNMAITKVKKSFIFSASIAQSCYFFVFSSFVCCKWERRLWSGSWKTWWGIGWSYIDAGSEKRRAAAHTFLLATGSRLRAAAPARFVGQSVSIRFLAAIQLSPTVCGANFFYIK